MSRIWILFVVWTAALACAASLSGAAGQRGRATVPRCRGISLSASYLSVTGPGGIPGFQFTIENDTSREIRLAEPVPSSSHWYARSGIRWLWRASNGAGGSLLNALNERGRIFAFSTAQGDSPEGTMVIGAHKKRVWIENQRQNPVLEYKPGCQRCSYPGERDYRVVFAYAYLPPAGEKGRDFLECGLRSKPVPMPPKAALGPEGNAAGAK